MAITSADVKMLKSERLTDEDDGGGRATGTAVVDGEVNNLFPDISRLDRTTGRISLRKVYAGVVTANRDAYLGAHSIVTEKPLDPRVSVLLFNTASQTDQRSDARDNIESYVAPGSAHTFELLGNHLVGQRSLVGIQRVESDIPDVGSVVYLTCAAGNQYCRITKVEHSVETFVYTYTAGNYVTFERRRMVISISSALTVNFPGGEATPSGTSATSITNGLIKAQVLTTQVADAARYYGIAPVTAITAVNDLNLKVESIYSQLVPSTQREDALVDEFAGYERTEFIQAGTILRSVNLAVGITPTSANVAYLGSSVTPGSLTGTMGGGVYKDNKAGKILYQSGNWYFAEADIDYETGAVTFKAGSTASGTLACTFYPAVAATGETVTGIVEVELATRGYVYTISLAETLPRARTFSLSYMALGKWYTLSDVSGIGTLTGTGVGTIDYASGSVVVTLSALPDVDSALIYSYVGGADTSVSTFSGAVSGSLKISRLLANEGLKPASLVITWVQGGVTKTATSDVGGILSGDGTGYVNFATGQVDMVITTTPDADSTVTFTYELAPADAQTITTAADGSGLVSFTLTGAPLKAGSVSLLFGVTQQNNAPSNKSKETGGVYSFTKSLTRTITDNGAGGWVGTTGTINYTTGACVVKVEQDYNYNNITYVNSGFKNDYNCVVTVTPKQEQFGGIITATSQLASTSYTPTVEAIPVSGIALSVVALPSAAGVLIPNSFSFSLGESVYVARGDTIYKDINPATNAGTAVGTLDTATRVATLTTWPFNTSTSLVVLSSAVISGGFGVTHLIFRTRAAPIRSGSLQITGVLASDGSVFSMTADTNGNIDTPYAKGYVDVTTGIVKVIFTTDILDETGASAVRVYPSTLKYNSVVQTSLPLDADLIGLDPVRLPSDGRVPIFRAGDVAVLHNTAETVVASPVPGGTLSLGRTLLSYVEVIDSEGLILPPAQYTVNTDTGVLTWANPLVLQDASAASLTLPLTVRDRVEHMALITEAQITGDVSISSPIPWALPTTGTYLSSAVAWGDLQARIYSWFTQQTWNSSIPNWTDTVSGGTTTAQYNSLSYPPIITNLGAIDGKWAIIFTGSTNFNVVEEKLGVVATGGVAADCSPINPTTGTPYFTIKKEGWGTGWSTNNAVRFNTEACLGPLWIVRTVLSGKGTVNDDRFKIQIRGDAD